MNRKPVIALLCDFPVWLLEPSLPQQGWHYAVWLISMYEAFRQQSHYEIHWITFAKGVWCPRTFEREGQVFHVLPGGSLRVASWLRFLPDRLLVKHVLRRLQPDLLHVWGTESRYALCGVASDCPRILSMQGVLTAIHERCPLSGFALQQQRTEKLLMPQYDLITSESEWGCARCREIAPKTKIVRWEYAPEERFFTVDRCLTKKPTFLMAGNDSPIKNTGMVLHAFSTPALADMEIRLAGTKAENYPGLPSNIKLLGGVGREEIHRQLGEVWGLVHPSLADTSPNIIKEARVAGVPVITSTECGGAQYVQENESGYVVEPHDEAALIRAVRSIAVSAERAEHMGESGKDECRCLLSREAMMRRLKVIYAAVLQGKIQELV